MNTDGTLDTNFATVTGVNNYSYSFIQPDGKILIGGSFTGYNGSTVTRIARLGINYAPTITTPTNGQYFYNTGAVLVTGSGFSGATISTNIANLTQTGTVAGNGTWSFYFTGLANGNYTVTGTQLTGGFTGITTANFALDNSLTFVSP